ncbi:hypothetical protein PTQ19_10285 [Microbacterium esteraromaticum]|uniref:hypothetical protein n=1 Tax=Microbacterium esteraromaticum TaxID=57043 RepID=UPI00236899B1|nr:hypothetical protein [Microbacterium esteraromaticum]WDH77909.1 hypothetical protein PTQ19_10285 [Microbacterium esteraromaticum]
MSSATIAAAFAQCISAEIENHAPLDFETVFEIASEHVDPESLNALARVERLAEALDQMLKSARALA